MAFLYPWGDLHRLNLGWFLQKFDQLRADWQTAEQNIDGALDAEIQRAEDALTDVFAARDAAAASATAANGSALNASASSLTAMDARDAAVSARNVAQSAASGAAQSAESATNSATLASNKATQAVNSASAAQQSETNAATEALKSEGYAVGKQNGTDVGSDSPYYHNNSKYYAESTAADAAAANADALKSEGYAVGKQNGTDVESGSPYYQNNAKYYNEKTEEALESVENTIIFADCASKYLPSIFAPITKLARGLANPSPSASENINIENGIITVVARTSGTGFNITNAQNGRPTITTAGAPSGVNNYSLNLDPGIYELEIDCLKGSAAMISSQPFVVSIYDYTNKNGISYSIRDINAGECIKFNITIPNADNYCIKLSLRNQSAANIETGTQLIIKLNPVINPTRNNRLENDIKTEENNEPESKI